MKHLNLKYPLIVAPMAGGPSTAELVSESSRAGALGSVGAAYMSPDEIQKFVDQVRMKTDAPFSINLFCPHSIAPVYEGALAKAIDATKKYRDEFSLPAPNLLPPYEENFDAQFEKVMQLKPVVFSFVFGLLSPNYIKDAKRLGIYVVGTATTLHEAHALEELGVDAVTLQGIEGGGHRGLFNSQEKDLEVTMMDLLKQCAGKIKIPLIAAGGIMNADHIKAALKNGAQAVQMGTAFLMCSEAGTSAPYRNALSSDHRETKTTRVFSGRLARGIKNRFMEEMEAQHMDSILPFPAQNKFTRDLRMASAKNNSADFLSLWAGTGQGQLWQGRCEDLIRSLF